MDPTASTDTMETAVPPDPVQVKVKVEVALTGPTTALPEVARLPDHAPDAEQDEASVEDQVSVTFAPASTLASLALRETVGSGSGSTAFTVTLTAVSVTPPVPLQLIENVVFAFSGPTASLPDTALEPDHPPAALQLVALADDHVSVTLSPASIVEALALKLTVGSGSGIGAATSIDTDEAAVPPCPEQVNVNVVSAFKGPTTWLPDVAWVPLQPPDAVQLVAFVDDHVSVALSPESTALALDVRLTLGESIGSVPLTDTSTEATVTPPNPEQLNV